jgi:hypothetical protein
MKNFTHYISAIFLFLLPLLCYAQEAPPNTQAYWIHEDRVKPGMSEEYEQIGKDLVAACKEHNIQDIGWLTLALDDFSYLYVSPIEKFGDLDKNGFATLSEKMGADKLTALFSRFDTTYFEHGDYVVYLDKDLSYMPGGVSQTVEGQNYRTMYYYYVTPDQDKGFMKTQQKIKASFEKHNSKLNYRVYKSGFGVMGTYYMIAIAAQNEMEGARTGDENWKLMKDDFDPLLKELNKHTWKVDEKRGWIREDLGYNPSN